MSFKRYAGAAAGATLGFIGGDIPGAFVGGSLGYKYSDTVPVNLPQNKSMVKRKYVSPSAYAKKRARLGYVFHGGKVAGRSTHSAFVRGVSNGKRVIVGRKVAGKRTKQKQYKRTGIAHANPTPYSGKFKKPKRVKQTMQSRCLSQGYMTTIETHGTVNDPDCVYAVHSTGHIYEMCQTIAVALLRKIMTKAGYKITNQNNTVAVGLPVQDINPLETSIGLRFVFTVKRPSDNTTRNYTYDTNATSAFVDIARSWITLRDRMIDYVRGSAEELEPYKIAVYNRDIVSPVNENAWQLGAEIFLEDCKLELNFQSNLTVQNRTLAALNATGAASDQVSTDRVDSQPIKGWLYEFKHADPRVRHSAVSRTANVSSNLLWGTMKETGMRLIRGNEFTGPIVPALAPAITTWSGATEPFDPKYFANIAKATSIILQPGEIKKTSFTYSVKGKFINLMKRFKVTHWDTTAATFSGMMGKSQMVALEEVMRTNSTNKVTLAYERELKIGCIVTASFRQAPLETSVVNEEYNNAIA